MIERTMLFRILLVSHVSLATPVSLASSAEAQPSRIQVILVGGQGSTEQDMSAWREKVDSIDRYRSLIVFRSIPLPSAQFEQTAVVRDSARTIADLIEEIDKSDIDQKFILVGHSSGSAVTNDVARRVKDKIKVRLVILDGFVPRGVSQSIRSECWSAVDTNSKKSAPNFNTMKTCSRYREYNPYGCKTSDCLHFTLINLNAAEAPVRNDDPADKKLSIGFQKLRPNLLWLDSILEKESKN